MPLALSNVPFARWRHMEGPDEPNSSPGPPAALNTYQGVRARAATSNLGRVLISFLFTGAKDLLLRVIRQSARTLRARCARGAQHGVRVVGGACNW